MARLSSGQRAGLAKSAFVFPDRAPGPGSYPIPDRGHAIAALRFAAGTKDEAAVRSAVCRKFNIGCAKKSAADGNDKEPDGDADDK